VKTTVLDDRMQRAPAFLFEDARETRRFADWLDERFDDIKAAAEARIPRDLVKKLMRADADMLWRARLVSNLAPSCRA
jgi:hydroxymethylglutaryl-CoA reductase